MKKFLSGILFFLISVCVFADTGAFIEGVIEVAEKDELPAGYFGKAAGYLPGDSVSITNPDTGITLQILNLGTLDASGGIAVLISQESAKSLGIQRNSGVKVKLAARSGYFDETVSGSAVLDEKTLPAQKTEESAAQPDDASSKDDGISVAAESSAPVAAAGIPLISGEEDSGVESSEPAEDPEFLASDEENVLAEDEMAEEPSAAENTEPYAADEESVVVAPPVPLEEEISAEDVEDETEEPVVVEEPAPAEENSADSEEPAAEEYSVEAAEEPYEDYESVDDGFLESKEAVEQPSPAEESEKEEAVVVEAPAPLEDEIPAEVLEDEIEEEAVIVEEPAPVEEDSADSEETAAEEDEVSEPVEVKEPSVDEEIEEEAVVAEEPAPVEEDSAVEENTDAQSSDGESDDYAPIILVPSEPEIPEPYENSSSESEPVEIVPVESAPEPKPQQPEYPVDIQEHIVASEDMLETGCYYIQIATMGSVKNIENLLNKYSKYPVSLVPAGKNYRVLVGPLSVDEYGAVLAKFKDAGFKDAFVRKR